MVFARAGSRWGFAPMFVGKVCVVRFLLGNLCSLGQAHDPLLHHIHPHLPMSSMSWLAGEHRAVLDSEARILLPLGLRNTLNPLREEVSLMASLEPEGCVCVRRIDQWDAYVQGLRSLAGQSQRDRRVLMFVAATSAQIKIDRQGRLRIPDSLLTKAGIERGDDKSNKAEVVIAGNFEDLQIWAAGRWDEFCSSALDGFAGDLEGLHQAHEPAPFAQVSPSAE
ncbi:MAG: MraZ protein [Planctomycetota bacterium]|jgi:MraZ protein